MSAAQMLGHAAGALGLALALLGAGVAVWRLWGGRAPGPRLMASLALALFFVFLALHPFPSRARLDCGAAGIRPQLVPLRFAAEAAVLWREEAPVAVWLGHRVVATAGLNFGLFALAGWLVAGGRRPLCAPSRALAGGIVFSLGIETAQLTGLLGLYPCAYRQFDIDDLILNAAGLLLGVMLARAGRPPQTEMDTR